MKNKATSSINSDPQQDVDSTTSQNPKDATLPTSDRLTPSEIESLLEAGRKTMRLGEVMFQKTKQVK